MQTLQALPSRTVAAARSVATALLVAATALSLTACSAPRLQQTDYRQPGSGCSNPYRKARSATQSAADTRATLIERYLASVQAATQWSQVAANCTTRFAEGTMRAAQAMAQQLDLTEILGQGSAPTSVRKLDSLTDLQIAAPMLSSMIVAEDRAGFAIEVLTARGSANASLPLSDDHKTAAEQLVRLMNTGRSSTVDPRQKVYEVRQLIAHPDEIADTVNGISAPTTAVVEMDCAREEIAAFSKLGSQSGSNESQPPNPAALLAVSRLISAHAYQAFVFGYPVFDGAIF